MKAIRVRVGVEIVEADSLADADKQHAVLGSSNTPIPPFPCGGGLQINVDGSGMVSDIRCPEGVLAVNRLAEAPA